VDEEMKGTVRNPIFLIGFVFIIGLIIASFVYSEMTHNHVKYIRFIYDRKGKVIESPPLSPRWNIPLGTDRNGGDMLSKMLLGAKYTILTAFFVSLLRMELEVHLETCAWLHGCH
jgi:peptide/nickel transport system permease protein